MILNKIHTLLILLTLVSCGTTRISSKISKDEYDVLRGESLARYPETTLHKLETSENPLVKGTAQCALKNFKDGQVTLLNVVKEHKEDPIFWNALAVCSLNSGVYQKSEFYISLGLRIKGIKAHQKSILKTNQGMLYLKLRHFSAARESFEEASKLNPEANTPKFNLAYLYLKFAHFERAHNMLTDVINQAPKDQDVIAAMATYYAVIGDYKKALTTFEMLPESILAREDISNAYALALYQDGQYEKSYLTLEHAQSTVLAGLRKTKDELRTLVSKKLTNIRLAKKEKESGRKITSQGEASSN